MNNNSFCVKSFSLKDIPALAEKILTFGTGDRVFCFYGSMGAGKTTLIKAMCDYLKVRDNVASPTFSIINEYFLNDGRKVYHFDFYRIKNINEVYDIGYEDYFYSENYCFIEWPELIHDILPESFVKIEISLVDFDLRDVVVNRIKS